MREKRPEGKRKCKSKSIFVIRNRNIAKTETFGTISQSTAPRMPSILENIIIREILGIL
jgi:hypothetical protein